MFAQCDSETPIPLDNQSLENWVDEGNYEDPAGDFWDTANRTVDLLPILLNPNVTKDTDAHTGTYSAKLVTSNWFTLITSATVFSGSFTPNQADPLASVAFGKPFTDTPDNFRVWYKYAPVAGDSAEAYTYLTRWNGSETVNVAEAYTKVYDATSEWTELDIPFTYFSGETPDSITMVFASSAAGDNFEGQVGNTIYIDDPELYYCTTGISQPMMSEVSVNVFPNPVTTDNIRFELSKDVEGIVQIFSNDGKNIVTSNFTGNELSINTALWSTGMYRYVIYDSNSTSALATGTIIKE
jgi:hypothetical protein